jgi:hypothetical protein
MEGEAEGRVRLLQTAQQLVVAVMEGTHLRPFLPALMEPTEREGEAAVVDITAVTTITVETVEMA